MQQRRSSPIMTMSAMQQRLLKNRHPYAGFFMSIIKIQRSKMRNITPDAIELIKEFERFSPIPYICPAGLATIGYGHVIKKGENFMEAINEQTAIELLHQDLKLACYSVLKNIRVRVSDNQFGALVSFTFNVGGGALQRSTLRQKINSGEHELVPNEFMRWVWAGGRKLRGLIRRRQREIQMYKS
jgi:lysozyme